ncbi:60S ribosomal protein L12 [Fukomys damarensis]|uniref:60S ribosomal protein L12 n=1 Tax=Fukomys damarensis TaxID=885580 RepID=A0A091DGD0_FUKDA|nr:60S ribosomal protein L12 [Fukomys damarensis]
MASSWGQEEDLKVAQPEKRMWHSSLARDLSGTIKEILRIAQSVGCNVDGWQHPHEIMDDINNGVVECPAS